jgi:putative redox protein
MKWTIVASTCRGGSGFAVAHCRGRLLKVPNPDAHDGCVIASGVMMKARIKWVEDRTFVGESGSGHKIVLGTAFGAEGRTPGPSPMELVLIGMGGCTAFDVVHILEKGREKIDDVSVELEAERAQQDPKVFTRIHMHFVVKGRELAPEKVERAIKLSAEKYCSASAMIAKTASITHDFELLDTGGISARAPQSTAKQ